MPQPGSTHSQQHFRGSLRLPTALLTRHRSAHTPHSRAAQSRDIQPDTSADAAPPRQQQGNGSIYQSWSISPATGSDTWAHDTRAGGPMMRTGPSGPAPQPPQPARTLPYQYPLFDHGLDWMELAAAAADVARFRAQQKQAKTAGGGSSSGSSKPTGAGDRMRAFRRQMRQLRDLPGWLLYRYYNWRVDTGSDLLLVTGMSVVLLWSAAVIKHTYIDSRAQPASSDMQPAAAEVAAAAAAASVAPAGVGSELQSAPPVADGAASTVAGSAAATAAAAGQPGGSSGGPLQEGALSLWDDVYQVLVLSFGENFPNARVTDPLEEVFSLLVALVGLAGFALALALVEQIVLETNLANVSRGSRVYESGHYLVLGWASSQSDQEVIIKLVGQLCYSARAEGGTTIVVLTEREKLEMEELFRRTIPIPARHGSRLVFRQGSPLLPADLSSVATSYARSTIIVSDQSRSRDEADAQSLRCAILLDELDDYRGLRKGRALGHIVVETRTANAVPLLRYSCSKRVIALPTGQLNARRLAGMVKRPFVSWVTQRIWAFDSKCSVFLQPGKDHVGLLFRQVPLQYPDAVVLGVANTLSGRVRLNPPANYRVEPHDSLVLIRPTAVPAAEYGHLPVLLSIPELEQLGQQQLALQQEAAAAAQDKFGAMVYPLRHLLWRLLAAEAQETGGKTAAAAAAAAAAVPAALEGARPPSSSSSSSTAAVQQRYPGAGITTASDDVPSAPAEASGSAGSTDWSGGTAHSNPDSATASIDSSSSSSSTGHQTLARAAADPAAEAAASLPVTNGNGNGSISSSSSRSLARSSSSSSSTRGLACNSAILSTEEDIGWELPAGLVGGAGAGAPAAAGAGVVSDEDDSIEDDGQHFVEGDSSSSSSNASAGDRSGGSSSSSGGTNSLSGSVLNLWPEPPGAAAAVAAAAGSSAEQQQQQQEVGGGGYMVAGWSTLESTMDSIDALPGFGTMQQATTLDSGGSTYSSSNHQPGSSDAGSSSSSSGGGTVSAAAAAGRPAPLPFPGSAASPAATAPTPAPQQQPPPLPPSPQQQANPGAAAFSQQQPQPQQESPSAFVDGAAVKTVDGAKSPSPVSAARDPAAVPVPVPVPPPGMVPKWQMVEQPSNSSFNYVPREYLSADSSPEAVLVTGWSEPGFMGQLLWELDQGQSALPPGSEIVFVNAHLPEDTLGRVLNGKRLNSLKVSHVSLDPLRRDQLAVLPLHRFRAAIVLADEGWGAGDSGEAGKQQQMQMQQQQQAMASPGDVIDQPSVLRQDALMVMVQLNIRKLLEEAGLPPINIICQKVANQGLTRFEDRRRLPLGISVNFNSMAAKLLTQVAVSPLTLAVLTHLGGDVELSILDASEYCSRDEAISFWGVLSRAQTAGHVLLGYYVLPSHIDQPIESTINPQGLAVRSKRRVWNTGDGRLKFLIVRDRDHTA